MVKGHSKPETSVIKKTINDGIINIEMMKARVLRRDIIFNHPLHSSSVSLFSHSDQ